MNENMNNTNEFALDMSDLVVEYRTEDGIVQAVNGLDLQIEHGSTLGLVGETGAGKTTAGLSILKLVPSPPGVIVRGSILLDGEDVLKKTEKEMEKIRGKRVSMIFQDPMTSLNPVMTVEERIRIEAEVAESISMLREYRAELEANISKYLKDTRDFFDETFSRMKSSLQTGDIDGYIASTNAITRKMGKCPYIGPN